MPLPYAASSPKIQSSRFKQNGDFSGPVDAQPRLGGRQGFVHLKVRFAGCLDSQVKRGWEEGCCLAACLHSTQQNGGPGSCSFGLHDLCPLYSLGPPPPLESPVQCPKPWVLPSPHLRPSTLASLQSPWRLLLGGGLAVGHSALRGPSPPGCLPGGPCTSPGVLRRDERLCLLRGQCADRAEAAQGPANPRAAVLLSRHCVAGASCQQHSCLFSHGNRQNLAGRAPDPGEQGMGGLCNQRESRVHSALATL